VCIVLEYLTLLVSSVSASSCVRAFASYYVCQYLVVQLSIVVTGHTVSLGQYTCGITGALSVMASAVAWHPRTRLKLIMVMRRGTGR
jgi:hypothetical protein